MFLSGEYARDEEMGGMLGYVQSGEVPEWLARLKALLAENKAKYAVTSDGGFEAAGLISELPQIHRSRHGRSATLQPILIFHTLLSFVDSGTD
jgi:hypothetical protein